MQRGSRKVRVGKVVSDKMDKTIVVAVERSKRHPLYGKIIRRAKNYMVHDESNECKAGDKVRIMETRPLSRKKRWRLIDIIEKTQL